MATTADNVSLAGVASGTSSVTIVAANPRRAGLVLENVSTAILYLRFGGGTAAATSGNHSVLIPANTRYAMPDPIYTGLITGVWAAANGFVNVTELT